MGGRRDALEGKRPQRRPQKRLERRLEEVAEAVGGSYCRLQMPLKPALGVRGTVAGRELGTLEGGGGGGAPPPSNASLLGGVGGSVFSCPLGFTMMDRDLEAQARVHFPQANGLVGGAAQQLSSIGAEVKAHDLRRVPLQNRHQLPVRQGPQLHNLVHAPRGHNGGLVVHRDAHHLRTRGRCVTRGLRQNRGGGGLEGKGG